MTPAEVALLIRASAGVPGEDRPWPPALDPRRGRGAADLRPARGHATSRPPCGRTGSRRRPRARARRLLGRTGHVTALRHGFPAPTYAALVGPFRLATGIAAAPNGDSPRTEAPGVRRAR